MEEPHFNRSVFEQVFKSNLDALINGMMREVQSKAQEIGYPIRTDFETRTMAKNFFQKSLAKRLYEYLDEVN